MALPTEQDPRILELYRALTKKNKYVAELFGDHPPLNPWQRHRSACRNTFLHIAIRFRQFELVDLLLETLPESLCEKRNDDGNTILHELAADDEWERTAMKVVDKDPQLLIAPNELKDTPIFSAVRHGQFFMFLRLNQELLYRYKENPEQVEKCLERDDKTTVLHAAVTAEHFSLAHIIAVRHSHLIPKTDEDGMTAFQYLAGNSRAFERQKRKGEEFLEDSTPKMTEYNSDADKFKESHEDKPLG